MLRDQYGLLAPVLTGKRFHLLLLALMLLAMWTPVPLAWQTVSGVLARGPASLSALHAQPALLDLAAQYPDDTFEVIVQKVGQDKSVEATVRLLGGEVLLNLSIINGFSARIPGSAVAQLASDPGVRWVSLDARVNTASCRDCVGAGNLISAYNTAINVERIWNNFPFRQGQGVTVAVLDSGMVDYDDLKDPSSGSYRMVGWRQFTQSQSQTPDDYYGHGNHVAGIIGGNGDLSDGAYIGVAPKVNLVNVKVSNDQGVSRMSDAVAGLQWILANKDQYNIRVVNISLNSSIYEPYHVSPLCAAAEVLWFNRIVVVASAGNSGGLNQAPLHPPANDPFVITVGATDDRGTPATGDDLLAPYSSYGTTLEGVAKPDLVAPGTNIVSLMGKPDATLVQQHPDHLVDDPVQSSYFYFRMSGTSMAAPMVSGAAALLLEDEPHLNPDQVKYRLKSTARAFGTLGAGAGHLDVFGAVRGSSLTPANVGVQASQLLWTGLEPITWGSVNWNSVNWNSVNWNSVNWNSVNWNSVNWSSAYWGP